MEKSICCGASYAWRYHSCDKCKGITGGCPANIGVWKSCSLCDKPFEPQVEDDEKLSIEMIVAKVKKLLASQIKQAEERAYDKGFDAGGQTKGGTGRIMYQRGQGDYKQFILNILDGVDIADKAMNNKGGGTLAIRYAIASRIITNQ